MSLETSAKPLIDKISWQDNDSPYRIHALSYTSGQEQKEHGQETLGHAHNISYYRTAISHFSFLIPLLLVFIHVKAENEYHRINTRRFPSLGNYDPYYS